MYWTRKGACGKRLYNKRLSQCMGMKGDKLMLHRQHEFYHFRTFEGLTLQHTSNRASVHLNTCTMPGQKEPAFSYLCSKSDALTQDLLEFHTLIISTNWSTPLSPGKIGCPSNSSANTQPADHTSEKKQEKKISFRSRRVHEVSYKTYKIQHIFISLSLKAFADMQYK